MSGYLEVKYPPKSNLALNPFKSWKRQWCILRPSPTCVGGGSLAVYCSEAGSAAGTVELPPGCIVKKTKSRSRPYAFAVFTAKERRRPQILLAASSQQDSQSWMDKISAVLSGNKLLGTEALFKDSYTVMIIPTDLSRVSGLTKESTLSLSSSGMLLSQPHKLGMFVGWKHITNATIITDNNKRKTCAITIDSKYTSGGGQLIVSTPLVLELVSSLKEAVESQWSQHSSQKLSKSEGDLRELKSVDEGGVRRNSWSKPAEVSLDDTALTAKESKSLLINPLSRCTATSSLTETPCATAHNTAPLTITETSLLLDDSMSDRRSLLSVASGIYEEIPELPVVTSSSETTDTPEEDYCPMRMIDRMEPMYESVTECLYATMRRTGKRFPPPPLPPRVPFGTLKLDDSWNSRTNKGSTDSTDSNVTRHCSLGSIPRCFTVSSSSSNDFTKTRTLPKPSKQGFTMFRKRLKSDSRLNTSPKSESKEKDLDTKKKKFDFTPTKDIFKSLKVCRKKCSKTSILTKETKSCEFLDETDHVGADRGSKSVECLEELIDECELEFEFNDDAVSSLAFPQEVIDLIMRNREKINSVRERPPPIECDYMPMSPIIPQQPGDQSLVMEPETNLA